MANEFRDQINTARRAGYSDDELVGYLKDKDPRITQALDAGYKPNEIMEHLAPKLSTSEEFVRKAGVAVRGVSEALAPVAAGAGAGMLMGGPVGAGVGALAGGLAVPLTDAATMAYNKLFGGTVRAPSNVISEALPGPRAETPVERVIQSSAGALGGTTGSVTAGRALTQAPNVSQGLKAIGTEASRLPVAQVVTAPIATAVGQTTTELTDNPLAGLAAAVATGTAAGVRPTKRTTVPTADELKAQSDAAYKTLDNSSFQFFRKEFNQHMDTLPGKIRSDVGYVEGAYPKIDAVMTQLKADRPKDITELTTLRKIISGAAKGPDAQERMIASAILDEFDDYLMKAPNKALIVRDPDALKAWKEARADYAKMKKSELITDIIENAELAKGTKESSIASQLSSLAKNNKKMRFFTPEEQAAIREAAKGGKLQSMMNVIGKFSPTTPAAAIFTAVNPFGAYTAGAGMAARSLADQRRIQQANLLANRIRLGQAPKVTENALANVPTFTSKSIQNNLNMLNSPQNRNALAE